MDPYIEACGLWEDFHGALIYEIKSVLAQVVPERYLVRSGERSYVVLVEQEGKKTHPFLPDVSLTTPRGRRKPTRKGGGTLVEPADENEPVTMRAFIEEEHRESFIEIYEVAPEQRLVTTVEVLSPSNKRPGTPGWDLYQRKRQSLLLGKVSLVEIDLLRGGQPMAMEPRPTSDYHVLVSPEWLRPQAALYSFSTRDPLPTIPVPLRRGEPAPLLALGPLLAGVYDRARYDLSLDYGTAPPEPPLPPETAAWLEELLRAQGLRERR
jgi:hypothetical protein